VWLALVAWMCMDHFRADYIVKPRYLQFSMEYIMKEIVAVH